MRICVYNLRYVIVCLFLWIAIENKTDIEVDIIAPENIEINEDETDNTTVKNIEVNEIESDRTAPKAVEVNEVEMDEMWSFYHDKSQQEWLWWAIDHILASLWLIALVLVNINI